MCAARSSSSSSSMRPASHFGRGRMAADCRMAIPEVWEKALGFLNIQDLTKVSAVSLEMFGYCAPQDVWEHCLANVGIKVSTVYVNKKGHAEKVWYESRNVMKYVTVFNDWLVRFGEVVCVPLKHDPVLQSHELLEFIRRNGHIVAHRFLLETFAQDEFTPGIDAILEGRLRFEQRQTENLASLRERLATTIAAQVAAREADDTEGEQLHWDARVQIDQQILDIEREFEQERGFYIIELKKALSHAIENLDFELVTKLWNELQRCENPVIHENTSSHLCMPGIEQDYLINAARKGDTKILQFIISKIGVGHPSLKRALEYVCRIGDFRSAWTLMRFNNLEYTTVLEKIMTVACAENFSHEEQFTLFSDLYRQLASFGGGFMTLFADIMKTPAIANPLIAEFFVKHELMPKDTLLMYAERLSSRVGSFFNPYSDESLQVFIRNMEPFKTCLENADPSLKDKLSVLLVPYHWPILKKIAEQNAKLTDPSKLEEMILHELRQQMVVNCCSSNFETVMKCFSKENEAWMQEADYVLVYETAAKTSPSPDKAAILDFIISKLRLLHQIKGTPLEVEGPFLEAVRQGNKVRFAHYFKSIGIMSPAVIREAYIASLNWMDNEMESHLRPFVPDAKALFIKHRKMQ